MHKERSSGQFARDILYRLNSADAGAAWAEFIDYFAPLIMNTAKQFEYEQNRVNECFIFVAEQLCDNRFQRLLKFNTAGKASFHTWLVTVVYNLCVDWHRKEFGRVTLLPAISALPAFDQMVFRYSFEQAMEREACFETLKADFPDLTRQQFTEAISRVHSVLTSRQRWQISVRHKSRKSTVDPGLSLKSGEVNQLADQDHDPGDLAQSQQDSQLLQDGLSKLSPDERLLLMLRYQDGLTLKKIAEITHLGDPFRARREIETALGRLSGFLSQARLQKLRKN